MINKLNLMRKIKFSFLNYVIFDFQFKKVSGIILFKTNIFNFQKFFMEIYSCSLCGDPIYPGHGTIFVKNNYKIFRFCKSKCAKLFQLKKNPFFLRWTSVNRKIRGMKLFNKQELIEKMEYGIDKNKKYNSYLIFQTLYLIKRAEKIFHNRCLDYKLKKKNFLLNK